jgi:hypothetical protein
MLLRAITEADGKATLTWVDQTSTDRTDCHRTYTGDASTLTKRPSYIQ